MTQTGPPAHPFLTVGIPTFNRAGHLAGAIESILRQGFRDYELLVSDNHSSDDTEKVVAGFDDPRIRYVRQERNLGAVANFNYLLAEARGEFLVFNQDDDRLLPDFLERCHRGLREAETAVLYGAPMWRGSEASGYRSANLPIPHDVLVKGGFHTVAGVEIAVSCLYSMPLLPPALAFRRSVLKATGGLHELVWCGDVITVARVLCEGDAVCDSRIGGWLRAHEDNASSGIATRERRSAYAQMIDEVVAALEAKDVDWGSRLADQLRHLDKAEFLRRFRGWVRVDAPDALLDLAWNELRARSGSPAKLLRTALAWLGPAVTLRLAGCGGIRARVSP